MVEVIVSNEKLTLALPKDPKLYVKPLTFPWSHITGAEIDRTGVAPAWFARLMFFASKIPDIIRPGVYYEDGSNVFWGIDDPTNVIGISLRDEPYKTLFIEVKDPREAVEIIETALKDKEAGRELKATPLDEIEADLTGGVQDETDKEQ